MTGGDVSGLPQHTVGATIEGQRVPDRFQAPLLEMLETIRSGDFNPVILIGQIGEMLSRADTYNSVGRERHDRGIFSPDPNFDKRFQPDYAIVGQISETMKLIGQKVVLTSGTYDLTHIGHARYITSAKEHGDFLIVGVDSDSKVRDKKGPTRPIVPEEERLEMLAHLRGVDLITLKGLGDEKWRLIKTVQPDTLIATEGTYSPEQVGELEANWVGRVIVLPPQALRSTSALVRLGNIAAESYLIDNLRRVLCETPGVDPAVIEDIIVQAVTPSGDTK